MRSGVLSVYYVYIRIYGTQIQTETISQTMHVFHV